MEHKIYKKVVLVIFDGFGVASPSLGNAISIAKKPNLNYLVANYPSLTLQASGPLVGLPWGEMGNSEVGHLNIGAGRIVGQDLPRITMAIQSGEFFKVQAFVDAVNHAKKNNSTLHLMGMVSPGGVHSLDEHLFALLGLAAEMKQEKVCIHMFTDGRDTAEKVALETIKKMNERISKIGVGKVATVTGRFYAMDRGGHWDQTELTFNAIVNGVGEIAYSAAECVSNNYNKAIYDEMIRPTVILEKMSDGTERPVGRVGDNDAAIFINFRQDRAIQLSQMLVQPEKVPEKFRHKPFENFFFVTMTEYTRDLPSHIAFPQLDLKNNLAQVISRHGYTQFHIAESEKYAHVTMFFNCGVTEQMPGEDRTIVTSPENNSRNYVDKPQMSAEELTDVLTSRITSTNVNFFVANYANGDMVGHTGKLDAATQAVEYLDKYIKKVVDACMVTDACLIITADHGNVEQMINFQTGEVNKDHTTNPVPFLLVSNEFKFYQTQPLTYESLSSRVPSGTIGDIAPTILELFGMPRPPEMTGINLLDMVESEQGSL